VLVTLIVAALFLGVFGVALYLAPVDRWGDKVRVGEHLEVYQGAGVSREQVEKLGRVLLDEGLGKERPATARVVREKDRFTVYFFLDFDKLEETDLDRIRTDFDGLKDHLRGQVFGDTPVAIKLCEQAVTMTPWRQRREPRVRVVIE
jgi:hypothetical protein